MNMIAKAFSEGVKQALRLIKGGAINGQTAAKAAETVMKNMDKATKAAAKATKTVR